MAGVSYLFHTATNAEHETMLAKCLRQFLLPTITLVRSLTELWGEG